MQGVLTKDGKGVQLGDTLLSGGVSPLVLNKLKEGNWGAAFPASPCQMGSAGVVRSWGAERGVEFIWALAVTFEISRKWRLPWQMAGSGVFIPDFSYEQSRGLLVVGSEIIQSAGK